MDLGSLQYAEGHRKGKDKRVGRGNGSGYGKTSGRGQKGQLSRAGYTYRPWYEGGQMPIQRRLPKRGFTNIFRTEYQVVNVSDLERLEEKEIDIDVLGNHGLVDPGGDPVKILGDGEAPEGLTVTAHAFSKSAEEKITAAGGSVERL
ncbi:MAG: 50S ribosomal protein L15 [Candidatus Marinimicrobia bacterium]|nr:50S ribosomal protein L15 [Candidatus Neomarinimicrobiota bacterium]MCF7827491.1 50S ribosomal protein L15 [Candidatus Neomarinimicrobiota bacterium]MCF7882379.1 50S ribosomal protein L15 [Candidatus Neomarinimicrobiota bacterium]